MNGLQNDISNVRRNNVMKKKIFVCILGQQPKVQEIKDLYQFMKLEVLPVSVFRTKIFINSKVRKMLILAIGKNLQWERIELPSLLYLIQIFGFYNTMTQQ